VAPRNLRSSDLVTALGAVTLAALYVGASFVAPFTQLPSGQEVSLFWPSTGIGLAAFFYLRPVVVAPTILVSSFLLNAAFGRPLAPSLAAAVATAFGLTAIYLLLRAVGFHSRLDRLRDVLALVFLGALVGGMILGLASVGALVLSGVFTPDMQWRMTLLWGMSFGMGVLICTPVLLVLRHARWPRRIRPLRVVEAVGLEAAAVVVVLLIGLTATRPFFLAFPVVVWAALRFQMAGAAPVALFLSAASVYAQTSDPSPLVPGMGVIEAFIASITLTALVLAVIIAERDRAYRDMRHVSDQLLLAVHKLDRRLRPRPSEIAEKRDLIAERRAGVSEPEAARAAERNR
jgi:integral membrane sensor domain MASE1